MRSKCKFHSELPSCARVVSSSTSFSSYYHGKLSRRDAEDALRDGANNSWLIRYSENEGKEIVSMKRYQVQEAPGVSDHFCSSILSSLGASRYDVCMGGGGRS